MAALKALVIGMGVLIVAGVVTLFYMLATRTVSTATAYAERIPAVAGTRIVTIAGVGDKLAVQVEAPGGGQEILLVDPGRAKLVGRWSLAPTVPSAPSAPSAPAGAQ